MAYATLSTRSERPVFSGRSKHMFKGLHASRAPQSGLSPSSRREPRQALDRICANRAGIRAQYGQRRIGHEEGIRFELIQVLQHL